MPAMPAKQKCIRNKTHDGEISRWNRRTVGNGGGGGGGDPIPSIPAKQSNVYYFVQCHFITAKK